MINTFKIQDPDRIVFDMNISMKLSEWKLLQSQFHGDHIRQWPASKFIEQIDDMVSQAQKQFYPKAEPCASHVEPDER